MPKLEPQNDQELMHNVNINNKYQHDFESTSKRLSNRNTNQNGISSNDIRRKALHDNDE